MPEIVDYRQIAVLKPWGYEYLIFESDEVALWLLHIELGKSTSLHCHPTKTSGLVLLRGEAELSFIADKKVIKAPEKEMLRRGLFHATKALSEDVFLLEIENPKDKGDLVRLVDDYGRSSDGYENGKNLIMRNEDSIWISMPTDFEPVQYSNDEVDFEIRKLENLIDLKEINSDDIIMFLRGGLGKEISGRRHLATVPGDVGRAAVINKVASKMEFLAEDTIILRVGG